MASGVGELVLPFCTEGLRFVVFRCIGAILGPIRCDICWLPWFLLLIISSLTSKTGCPNKAYNYVVYVTVKGIKPHDHYYDLCTIMSQAFRTRKTYRHPKASTGAVSRSWVISGSLRKSGVPYFGGPYNKDPTI